jgi:hypothetical protein
MNPSPSTDGQYIDFNSVFSYKAGTYTAGTRYLRGRYLRVYLFWCRSLTSTLLTYNGQCMQTLSMYSMGQMLTRAFTFKGTLGAGTRYRVPGGTVNCLVLVRMLGT